MLPCSADLDSRVDEVVVVKIVGVVAESGGVPQVTLKFPPRTSKKHIYILYFKLCIIIFYCPTGEYLKKVARLLDNFLYHHNQYISKQIM